MTTRSAPARLRRLTPPIGIETVARGLLVLAAAGVVLYAAHTVGGVGKPEHARFFSHTLYDGIWIACAVIILMRAASAPEERITWTLVGLGVASAAASSVAFSAGAPQELQDAFRLATYPLFCAGILALARGRRIGRFRHAMFDALPAALAVGSIVAVVLVPRVEVASHATSQAVGVVAAAVAGDVLIAACAAALFMAMGRVRWTAALWLLGVAGLLAAVADGGLLVRVAAGTYVPGEPTDLLWPLAASMAAAAAWTWSRRSAALTGNVELPVLLLVGAVSVAGFAYAMVEDLDWAFVPCTAALVAAVVRAYEGIRREMTRARREEDALRQKDRFTSALLGGFSHELLGPLTAIGVAAERIPLTGSPERRREYSSLIGEEATRVERFVRSVMDLTRAESGVLKPFVRPTALVDVARDAAAAAAAELDGLAVEVDVDDALEVRADPALASRIVVNLLQNAARHGTPPVRMTARRDGDRVALVVEDAGPGVAPEARAGLFTVAPAPAGSGLGVGLALSRALAEAQGGSLAYAPRDGVAGRFVLSFPRVDG